MILNIFQEIFKHKRANKSFGQHFLTNRGIVDKIAEAINDEDANICEIGPGTGSLTSGLIEKSTISNIVAIEKDESIVKLLNDNLHRLDKLNKVIGTDATHINWEEISKEHFQGDKVVMVSNLPYNYGTQIIYNIIKQYKHFKYLVVMLQKEVAEKIMATPGSSNYSKLSTTCQIMCNISKIIHVSPGSFSPPPKVDSMVIKISIKPNISTEHMLARQIFNAGFINRRKTMRNNFKNSLTPEVISIIENEIDLGKRMETVSIDEVMRIATKLAEQGYSSIY